MPPQRRSERLRAVGRTRDSIEAAIQRVAEKQLAEGWRRYKPFALAIVKAGVDRNEQEFWATWGAELQSELDAVIQQAAVSVAGVEGGYFTGLGYELPDFSMKDVYRSYLAETGSRITNIDEDTRGYVAQTVTDWMATDAPQSELIDSLGQWFGPTRAALIASTEATALSASGTKSVMERLGLDDWIWFTAKDGIVCRKGPSPCAPKHGKRFTLKDPLPPGHPG